MEQSKQSFDRSVSLSRHHHLQNIVIRLLHDQTLLSELYQNPIKTRDHLGISDEELSWLVQIDQRRWQVDTARPHRSLEGALAHCSVTALVFSSWCALARQVNGTWDHGIEELIKYYQSEAFHDCIEQHERLAESLMAWLLHELTTRIIPKELTSIHWLVCELIQLELNVTRLRHEAKMTQPSSLLNVDDPQLNQERLMLSLPNSSRLYPTYEGVVELYLALYHEASERGSLDRTALLHGDLDLKAFTHVDHQLETTALLQRNHQGVSVEALSGGLMQVLQLAESRKPLSELWAFLTTSGFDPQEAQEQIYEWVQDGLLNLT